MAEIKSEDPTVQSFEILDSNLSPVSNYESTNVYHALVDPSQTYFLKLNKDTFLFEQPNLDINKEVEKMHKSMIAGSLNSEIGKDTWSSTLSAFLVNLENSIDSSGKTKFSAKDVIELMARQTDVEKKVSSTHGIGLAKKNVYDLNLKRIQINKSIEELQAEKAVVDRSVRMKTNALFSTIFLASLVEFLTGYYCIYEVEWLGWDLVEPLTYTIAQGKFVAATWFFWKYFTSDSFTDLHSFFTNRFKNKVYLKKQITEIDQEIEKEENKLIY